MREARWNDPPVTADDQTSTDVTPPLAGRRVDQRIERSILTKTIAHNPHPPFQLDRWLGVLARTTLAGMTLSRAENRHREDLHQVAVLAGLGAVRSAQTNLVKPAKRFVLIAMRSACYRELKRPTPALIGDVLDPDANPVDRRPQPTGVDARDQLDRYMAVLEPADRELLEQWAAGELAYRTLKPGGATAARIDAALATVRRAALEGERRSDGRGDALAGKRPGAEGGGSRSDGVDDHAKTAGSAGYAGVTILITPLAVNGWASEIITHASRRESNVPTFEVSLPEHTHVLLEKLIAATEAMSDEMRLLRLTLANAAPTTLDPVPAADDGVVDREPAPTPSEHAAGRPPRRGKGGAAR